MPRSYGEKLLRDLEAAEPDNLGQRLGRVCVQANIPMAYVAAALNTTRLTISHWFRGRAIRTSKHPTVKAFIRLIETDLNSGRLPAANVADAKLYISEMVAIQL